MTDKLKPARRLCFVDMPFGKKADPKTGTEINFDQIYNLAIKPAAEESGLECIRGDEERTGGIIHTAMFARLLLCEFVIADLTTANPNVFYELGPSCCKTVYNDPYLCHDQRSSIRCQPGEGNTL
jgi:hypothetical protein